MGAKNARRRWTSIFLQFDGLRRLIVVLSTGLGLLLAALGLTPERLNAHLLYLPLTLTAAWFPQYTLRVGIGLAGLQLVLEYTWFDTVTWWPSAALILIAAVLQQIGTKERRYQQTILALTDEGERDGLTGLRNRKAFERILASQLQYPVALFICDIDGLKTINDTFGHGIGDRYITLTSRILEQTVRSTDTVVRLGGDEFAILAQSCSEEQAVQLLGRIEEQLNAGRVERHSEALSVSVGHALAETEAEISVALIAADARMYRQKRSRRRVAGALLQQVVTSQ